MRIELTPDNIKLIRTALTIVANDPVAQDVGPLATQLVAFIDEQVATIDALPKPLPSVNDLWPFALCRSCGWEGKRTELREGSTPTDEACPNCRSEATEWTSEAPAAVLCRTCDTYHVEADGCDCNEETAS